jgi:hypothetical protein
MQRTWFACVLAALAWLASGMGSPCEAGAQDPIVPSWIQANAADQTAVVDVQAAWNASAGGLNFNGYGSGEVRIVVPVGWRITVKFFNSSLDLPHSIVITKPFPPGRFPLEAGPGEAAIPRAYTKSPVTGVYNDGDEFGFTASERYVGSYYMFCGVPTHGVAGMWVHFSVKPDAETPHILIETPPSKPGRP